MSDRRKNPNAADPDQPLALSVINGEPTVRDVDLGERLGMARPTNIRRVIEKSRAELEGYGMLHAASATSGMPNGGTKSVTEYHLTEPQALLVCIKSAAPRAPEVRRLVIEAFMAWRRGYGRADAVTLGVDDLKRLIREALEAERLASPQHVAIGFVSALDVAIKHKVPQKGRRAIVWSISARLRRHSAAFGYPVRTSAETGRYLFAQEAVDDWLLKGGFEVIHRAMSKVAGQGVLVFTGGKQPGRQ